ncbi:hypothetical protein BDW02DRAFT_603124 [Decorospora gaudefroyi]|uniref:Heterokaryon incompatibility domain-containing protein n=1 Tax=Decorospora gaudefroyi TaxID=184978 RepID=A0A6A5JXK0_9PLEO|nr:hypothetical protein BDW02DRAFT_603124 [Decorospora gaudefroyi]
MSVSDAIGAREEGFDLFHVLHWTRSRLCKDELDRIYAIIGLPYSPAVPWNRAVEDVVVNYDTPFLDLCLQIALGVIERGGTSALLNSVHHGPTLEDWQPGDRPSWLPRWDEDVALDFNMGDRDVTVRRVLSPPSTLVVSVDHVRRSLVMRCRQVGTVTACSDAGILLEGYDLDIEKIWRFWIREVKPTVSSFPGLVCAWHVIIFWNVFRGRRGNDFEDLSPHTFVDGALDTAITLMLQHNRGGLSFLEERALEAMMVDFQNCMRAVGRTDDLSIHLEAMRIAIRSIIPRPCFKENLRGRRLFKVTPRFTILEPYFGLGPEAMREGDILVEFDRRDVPLIFRSQGSFYQFVGAAFLPGVSQLTLFDDVEKLRADMEDFEIR